MTKWRWHRRVARTVLVTFTTCVVGCGGSQGQAPSTTTTVPVETTTSAAPPTTLPSAPPPTLPADVPQKLGQRELRDLVAPVALYPDVVLASLLPATTNLDQAHEAAQWVGAAQHVDKVPDDRGWDGSVMGLLQFPDVLRWLDQNPAWGEQMGQAVTYQQGDVLTAIQDFRRAARDVGNLKSNQYQTVRAAPGGEIYVEPARPDVVYVPSYDPSAATQPQPAQPSAGVNPWIAFGGGAVVGALGAWALYSIFNNDDDDHHHYYGGNQIHRYNNYYYSGGRRPPQANWTPRPRPYRTYGNGVQRPRPLQHTTTAGTAKRSQAALRPPMSASTMEAQGQPTSKKERREQHHEEQKARKEQQQEQKAEHREQRHEQQKQQKAQRREHQDEQQRQEAARREQRREREEAERRQRQETHQQKQQEQNQKQQERQQQKAQQPKQGQGGNGTGNPGKNGKQGQKKKGQGGQGQ